MLMTMLLDSPHILRSAAKPQKIYIRKRIGLKNKSFSTVESRLNCLGYSICITL